MSITSQKQTLLKENTQSNLGSDGSSDITLDATLSYISQILLEEDLEERDTLYHEELALSEMEKPFYDILGQKYPTSIDQGYPYQQNSDNLITVPACEFNKGVEEGMKFLPSIDKLVLNFQANKLSSASAFEQADSLFRFDLDGDEEDKYKGFMRFGSKGKKKFNIALDQLEGRNRKISMLFSEETAQRNATFDKVLLEHDNYMQKVPNLREITLSNTSKCSENDKVEVVDVENLLIQCSDAVYANDHQLAERLITEIRNQSSHNGDGTQRMAFAFADALEARLAGTGSEAWRRIVAKRISTFEVLRIVQLHITVCPFPRISVYYANQTILNMAKKASVLHIVDLGIGFGFQWPSLIQALSNQNMKTIKLRITGVDFPRPGFRPAELVEETGRRLEDYARSFNVPFEYRGIASKNWEAISLDDLKIKKDEVLIVNCLYRLREVGDEAVSLDSPRDRVLNLIYKMRPHIFIEGVLNIRTFSPFFITRFRQCLPLYSALFKLLDILIPRDNKLRQIIERDFLARDILNVLACEGSEWTMKPESYKQWHQRNLRAGFEQIPLNCAIVKECREILRKSYKNKIFFVEEDRNWMLQGWSGRAFDALSIWKPRMV
ncbi:scarecrow-like protein 9 [Carex littledalei]|uniref:Scarecrow-like protein 9 n=1 Tax=Carex littledalei TaxID=544730 RepID=A0A833R6S4_9POAL|nr:scarecrow-like protein 9 [Carex littledalei]